MLFREGSQLNGLLSEADWGLDSTSMSHDITHFAQTNYRHDERVFGIKQADRRLHMYVLGKTGSGKSTLIKNLVAQDIQHGHGVGVIDAHGDLIKDILHLCPTGRTNDVVYFDPADHDHPIGFNILESVAPQQRPLVASQVISVFRNIWQDSWGPRLEYILYNSVTSLLDSEGNTLLGIPRLLTDEKFRDRVVRQVKNPVVKNFWINEYDRYSSNFKQEAIAPVLNKVGQFLADPQIRNIVGQPKNKIDMGFMMDNRRILLCNLSKGSIGDDKTRLLGSLLVTKLFLAALKRTTQPEEERRDFYLYIDECQNLSTEIFASILSEARKYRLNLILAHQYLEQIPKEIKSAILGNVGTLITFRLGLEDALELENEFKAKFTVADLENIGKHQIYLKLAIDGVTSQPFSARTILPKIGQDFRNNVEGIIKTSRQKYGIPREIVEDKINRWLGVK